MEKVKVWESGLFCMEFWIRDLGFGISTAEATEGFPIENTVMVCFNLYLYLNMEHKMECPEKEEEEEEEKIEEDRRKLEL